MIDNVNSFLSPQDQSQLTFYHDAKGRFHLRWKNGAKEVDLKLDTLCGKKETKKDHTYDLLEHMTPQEILESIIN